MRSHRVVVPPPFFDDYLHLFTEKRLIWPQVGFTLQTEYCDGKLVYKNSGKQIESYEMVDGKTKVSTNELKLSKPRGAKPKRTEKQLKNNENKTIHRSNTIGNCEIVSSNSKPETKTRTEIIFKSKLIPIFLIYRH